MSVPSGKEREDRIEWLRAVPTNKMWAWMKFAEELADALEALTEAEQAGDYCFERYQEQLDLNGKLVDNEKRLEAEIAALEDTVRRLSEPNRSLDEALNSGDGSYRP